MEPIDRLRRFVGSLPERGTLLVVTGAGISVASGIPTFRGTDPGAIWKHDVTTMGTNAFFESDPVASWSWYLDRFTRVFDAKPNPAHVALATLERRTIERGAQFLLVTQNVDTLHEQAGSVSLVKVHGSADRARCTGSRCTLAAPRGSLLRPTVEIERFLAEPRLETVPRCPVCGSLLRQHVLWFDERYDSHVDYQFDLVLDAASRAERILFVGTSFSVGVTDAIVNVARVVGADVLSIDPSDHPTPYGVEPLKARAEDVLVALVGDGGEDAPRTSYGSV